VLTAIHRHHDQPWTTQTLASAAYLSYGHMRGTSGPENIGLKRNRVAFPS
jgi:hypothetical protein